MESFLTLNSRDNELVDSLCEHVDIAAEKSSDEALASIIKAIQNDNIDRTFKIDPQDHRVHILMKYLRQFFLEPGISMLMIM